MKCYLIAEKLSHSFSKPIHNALADYSYEYKELEESELADFFAKRDFDGLNVTIPYKQKVIKYLDSVSPEAEKIGAVNTVVKRDGKLFGYNTDFYGFGYQLTVAGTSVEGKDVVIIGRGGAAKTVVCRCEDKGAKSVRLISRDDIESGNLSAFYDAQILVNATPVGMYPDTGVAPVDISKFEKCEAVLDLIYNPSKTKLLLDAEKRGIKTANGLSMLVAQAKKACEFFTDSKLDDGVITEIVGKIENQTKNIVLIGMPGCGKSTVGKTLAEKLGKKFADCDEEVAKMGETPAEMIEKYGEEYFRERESEVLQSLCKKSGFVIATGGGAVTKERNYDIIHQNATVIFIERDTQKLATNGRPLSQGGSDRLLRMYDKRYPLYKKFSHFSVPSQSHSEKTAELIVEILNKR